VRDGDALRVALTAAGVQASVVDGDGKTLAGPGADVTAERLVGGDYLVKIEPTLDPAYYDVAFDCVPADAAAAASGCGCNGASDGSNDGGAASAALVGLGALLLRRRRRQGRRS